ncbi:uncharacterized protein LOC129749638 [Uranotaenia lowii]|uniref:uncharacterized protein LOC129749638 n=1 Tax=Uranotaenia lowii TaxID=190385 RepID=UPI00247959EB|nr:uncharacterized protein LOC129749638 [Uranotaenia lowii]
MTSGRPPKSHVSNPHLDNGHQLFNEMEKNEIYRRAAKMLQERCKAIQKSNERTVHRIHMVKKLLKRRTREVEILKNRLDKHKDGWRSAPQPMAVKLEESQADI